MASQENSIKHLEKTNTYPSKTLPKNCRGRNPSKLILWGHHHPDTKTRQRQHTKRKKISACACSVTQSWPHGLQHARPPCLSPTPAVYSDSCPLSWWCHPTISSLSSPSPPALNLSQHQGLFKWVRSSHQVAKVLEFQLQHQSLQWTFRTDFLWDGLIGSPCSPRDFQESSPTPQF